ncbi:creatinine amidohydrolase [Corynebacterium sp. CNJ-954]|uniref:creatininase family protein n=1 Tax=Corynebacterium sp. CNJ-954 TaxID=1904962 RepID=UPI00096704CB|nr:creatininase family protein [Corynebacterium sp. CNJ-954]OLT51994.1 creatinine amidohydrolase [Corynebacterium sp. CNJ-954]
MISASRRFADLTTAEVPAVLSEDSVLVLPTGAIEPHGPHLPVSTDLTVADAVASEAVTQAAASGTDVWLLPPLAYTKSDEHALLPGTMWLRPETFFQTVVDLGRSIAATPARRLLFVNCHGGNSALLGVALRELRRRFDLHTFLMSGPALPGETERGIGVHAGWAETSMMLHIAPDLVDMSAANVLGPQVADTVADCSHIGFGAPGRAVTFGWLSTDLSESGVVGDPTGASSEVGRRLFTQRVDEIVAALPEIASFTPGGRH